MILSHKNNKGVDTCFDISYISFTKVDKETSVKKTIIIILVAILALPMLFANSVADATLTLQTKVRDIVMHGFSTGMPEAGDSGVLEPIDVFGYLMGLHGDPNEFDGNYNPISFAQDNTVGYGDVDDFDFGESSYDIGYYIFMGNSPTNFEVSFKVSNFTHDDGGLDVVPWSFGYTQAGALNMGTTGTSVSSGEVSFTPVISSTISNSMKWAILKLTADFNLGNDAYFASGTYTATVVAHITTN